MAHPNIIGSSMLTIYPESKLFQEIQKGNRQEESETEKLKILNEYLGIVDISIPILKGNAPLIKEMREKLDAPEFADILVVDFSDLALYIEGKRKWNL